MRFCGDTRFAVGCGLLFEGTLKQMSQFLELALHRLQVRRATWRIEYTLSSVRFANRHRRVTTPSRRSQLASASNFRKKTGTVPTKTAGAINQSSCARTRALNSSRTKPLRRHAHRIDERTSSNKGMEKSLLGS
jgi:hypothetical protein